MKTFYGNPKSLNLPVYPTGEELYWPVAPQFTKFLGALMSIIDETNFTDDSALGGLAAQVLANPIALEELCAPYGARFRLEGVNLEVMEGEDLPPPPWEWRINGVNLELRSEQ